MQTVKASVILDDAYRLIRALQEVWEAWWWAELMTSTQVQLADRYDATEQYYGGETVYWEPTDSYYLALYEQLGNACADAEGEEETGWAQWVENEVLEAWDSTATYEEGDRVMWKETKFKAIKTTTGDEPDPDVDLTGSSDPWYPIEEWDPVAGEASDGPYGPVRMVSEYNPRYSRNAREYDTVPTSEGVLIVGLSVGRPWVTARRPTPIIESDTVDYAGTTTYTAVEAKDRVY